jgi:hypothetical protein
MTCCFKAVESLDQTACAGCDMGAEPPEKGTEVREWLPRCILCTDGESGPLPERDVLRCVLRGESSSANDGWPHGKEVGKAPPYGVNGGCPNGAQWQTSVAQPPDFLRGEALSLEPGDEVGCWAERRGIDDRRPGGGRRRDRGGHGDGLRGNGAGHVDPAGGDPALRPGPAPRRLGIPGVQERR